MSQLLSETGSVDACEQEHRLQTCAICLEPQDNLVSLCKSACSSACQNCLQQYLKQALEDTYYVQSLKCFGCNEKVSFSGWKEHCGHRNYCTYVKKMRNFLSLRCTSCHTEHSLFCTDPMKEHLKREEGKQSESPTQVERSDSLIQFENGEMDAKTFVSKTFGPIESKKVSFESKACIKARCDSMVKIAHAIQDLEKSFQFQFAFYMMYRSCIMPCTCQKRMCFYCKSAHHPAFNCQENIEKLHKFSTYVNYCRRCGIPLMKHDGCDSVRCICGFKFQWRQNDELNLRRPAPAEIGKISNGYIRVANGWQRWIPPPPSRSATRQRLEQEDSMPLERFNEIRNVLESRLVFWSNSGIVLPNNRVRRPSIG
jgi:hypothetical protein